MKIKRFRAKNFTEALEMVKKELGEDAVVLSTEEKRGIIPSVEVVAAIDFDESPAKKGFRTERTRNTQIEETITRGRDSETRGLEIRELLSEISALKNTIRELKGYGYELNLPPHKKQIVGYLRETGMRDEFVLRLCERAGSLEDLLKKISLEIKIKKPIFDKRAIMLAGPTGVGKTTTIAKLAWVALKAGKRTGLICLDTYRIGAIEQLRIYAKIMGIPLIIASNAQELKRSLEKFSSSRDTVFIDTTGRRPSDTEYIETLSSLLTEFQRQSVGGFNMEVHLLISANSDDFSIIESYNFYRNLPYSVIGFTKIDEALRFGQLYNFYLTYQKPVSYITTGQTVPDDIKFPTSVELASLILRKGGYFVHKAPSLENAFV